MIISIEGITCSGKTTLASSLNETFRLCPDTGLQGIINNIASNKRIEFSPTNKQELTKTISFLLQVEQLKKQYSARFRDTDICLVRDYLSIIVYVQAIDDILGTDSQITNAVNSLISEDRIMIPGHRFVLEIPVNEIRKREANRMRAKPGYWRDDTFLKSKMKHRRDYIRNSDIPYTVISAETPTSEQVKLAFSALDR